MSKLSKDIQRIISSYSAQEASEIIAEMIETNSKVVPEISYCGSIFSCSYKHNDKCQTDEPCTARYFINKSI